MKLATQPKQELLDRVGALIERIQGVDFMIPDDTGHFSIEDDLVSNVREVMKETADLMLAILELYDAEAAAGQPDELPVTGPAATDDTAFLKEIGAQISSRMAVQEVAGLAFVSRGQLLDMMTELDRGVELRQLWQVASLADSGLRRAGRALVAIESAMRECEGLPLEIREWQSLEDSLEVRRAYGDFRRAVLLGGGEELQDSTPDETLVRSLCEAAERIAWLRHNEIYPHFRIDDRLQIRRLQERILDWLDSTALSREEGARLWGDLVSFARLLAEVNRRQELREHDRLAVDGLYRRFFESGDVPEKLTASNLALLEPLLGLEDELDEIILNPHGHTGLDLKAPLERLRRELGRPYEGPAGGDPAVTSKSDGPRDG